MIDRRLERMRRRLHDISEKSNGLGLSARRILEAIAEGQESLVASASEAAVREMGREGLKTHRCSALFV